MKYCCPECGSKNVTMEAWVDINTYRFVDSPDEPSYHCEDCRCTDQIITVKQFKENQKEDE